MFGTVSFITASRRLFSDSEGGVFPSGRGRGPDRAPQSSPQLPVVGPGCRPDLGLKVAVKSPLGKELVSKALHRRGLRGQGLTGAHRACASPAVGRVRPHTPRARSGRRPQ